MYFSPQRLRAARFAAKLTQTQLAHELTTSERNVQRWEAGRNTPRADMVARIAAALGKPIEFFYANDGEVAA